MAKLQPAQARKLVDVETRYTDAKKQLDDLKRERSELRARYRDRIPLGKVVEVAGYRFKRSLKTAGARFRLSAFLEKHKLTKAMEPYVSDATEYEDWQIKPVTPGERSS